jgi:hypothetical protein
MLCLWVLMCARTNNKEKKHCTTVLYNIAVKEFPRRKWSSKEVTESIHNDVKH